MKKNTNILNLGIRSKIFNYILKNPGLHQRELSRELNIPKTTLRYHLQFLLKVEVIVSKFDGKNLCFFISNKVSNIDKNHLNILRNKVDLKIILCLLIHIVGSRNLLSSELEQHPNTISYHLKKLRKEVIIEVVHVNNGLLYRKKNRGVMMYNPNINEVIYRLKNPPDIYNLILTHYKSLFKEKILSEVFYLLKESDEFGSLPSKITATNSRFGIIIDFFYDVFPNPYHV